MQFWDEWDLFKCVNILPLFITDSTFFLKYIQNTNLCQIYYQTKFILAVFNIMYHGLEKINM